jgi:hypothetical protein
MLTTRPLKPLTCRKSHSSVGSSGGIFNVLLWEGQQFRRISVVSQ